MLDRISKADRVSLVGAVVLFIGLFLPWYGIERISTGDAATDALANRIADNFSANAFEALDVMDVVLLLLALGVGALIVLIALGKLDSSYHRFVESIGGTAAILVLIRIVFQPDGAAVKWGIFIALVGAAVIAAGPILDRKGKL